MDRVIRSSLHPDEDWEQLQVYKQSRIQEVFGTNDALTWDSLADYANYVTGLYEEQQNIIQQRNA